MTLSDRIRSLVQERNWSQAQLAQASGLDPSVLSRLLGGDRSWRKEHIACVAAAFSKTPEELVAGTDATLPNDGNEIDAEFVATLTKAHGALVGENHRLAGEVAAARRQIQALEEQGRRLTQECGDSRLALDREKRSRVSAEAEKRSGEERETRLTREVGVVRAERAALRAELDAARRQLAATQAAHAEALNNANHNYAVAKDLEQRLAAAKNTAVAVSVLGAAVMVGAAMSAETTSRPRRRSRRT